MHSQTIHQQKTYNAHSVYINTNKYKSTNLTPKHTSQEKLQNTRFMQLKFRKPVIFICRVYQHER